jgi:hypothetical protein
MRDAKLIYASFFINSNFGERHSNFNPRSFGQASFSHEFLVRLKYKLFPFVGRINIKLLD